MSDSYIQACWVRVWGMRGNDDPISIATHSKAISIFHVILNPGYRIEDSIRFLGDGTIRSDDTVLNDELDRVLNLNCALLKSNRKAVLDGLIDTLPKRGELPVATWERLLRDWNGESTTGNMREFCQVVVYWLRKRLRRT